MSSRNQEPGWGRSTARTVTWWCSQRARARAPAVSSRAGGRQGPTEMCTPDGMCISIVSREISWYFRGSSWVTSAAAPTPPSPPLSERPCALQRAQPLPVGVLGHCARSDLARWWTSCCRVRAPRSRAKTGSATSTLMLRAPYIDAARLLTAKTEGPTTAATSAASFEARAHPRNVCHDRDQARRAATCARARRAAAPRSCALEPHVHERAARA